MLYERVSKRVKQASAKLERMYGVPADLLLMNPRTSRLLDHLEPCEEVVIGTWRRVGTGDGAYLVYVSDEVPERTIYVMHVKMDEKALKLIW